jgi:2',3'-cyclic-nucleotide 2'-phosphodiesterase (5'-nucleotidase family)
VDTVIFDWGGTLTPWKVADGRSWWRIAARLAETGAIAADAVDATATMMTAADEELWRRARDEHISGTLAEVFAAAGLVEDEALYALYDEEWEWATFIDPDAPALLSALRERGIRVGVLSNTAWPRARHQAIFARDGVDHLICDALVSERDAEIALSPGFRWGASLLPGQPITFEDVTNACALSYPNCYRLKMTGARLKEVLEDVADNLFNPDPYYQQGGDMVRTGGLGFTIDIAAGPGKRISDITLLRSGKPLEASREYVVAGWASINEGTEGPPIWDVVAKHVTARKTIDLKPSATVKVVGV